MWSTSLRAKENAGAGCCCCSSLSKVGPGCSLPHCEPDFQYPAHFRSSFPSEQMWEGGKSCSLNEQGSVTAEPGAGGFFPQGRWSGGQGAPCSSCSSHGKWGSVLLPSLWHANHSPKKEKHFQVADIPFRTQRCSQAPVCKSTGLFLSVLSSL